MLGVSLALIVLLGRFSWNIFQGSPAAFREDRKACKTATKFITRDFDQRVTVLQALVLYTPIMQQGVLISLVATCSLLQAALKLSYVSAEERGLG